MASRVLSILLVMMALRRVTAAWSPAAFGAPLAPPSARPPSGRQPPAHPLTPTLRGTPGLATPVLLPAAYGMDTSSDVFNVLDYGANRTGRADATAAFQAAVNAWAQAPQGGTIFVPTGLYLLDGTVTVPAGQGPLTITGSGWGSNLLWATDADLFTFNTASPVVHLTVTALAVSSINVDKSAASTAFKFTAGVVQSLFTNLFFNGAGGIPAYPEPAKLLGTCVDTGKVADTLGFTDNVMWFLQGTGVVVGKGSEVRIVAGRIIGTAKKNDGSIGVHVTGNNGGVHIVSTDVIGLQQGVVLDSSSGAGSNREIFISQATMDSNGRGLAVFDNSYVSISGCWAASSNLDNIWISPSSTTAVMVIAGGTIFNAGSEGGDCSSNQCNGITINAGEVTITGVDIRYNKGKAVFVPNGQVAHLSVVGCHIFGNGEAFDIIGGVSSYLITNNIFHNNAKNGTFGDLGGGARMNNNVFT